jgi:hypothetical protein
MAAAVGAGLIALAAAGCGGPTADSTLGQFMRGTTQEPTTLDPATLRAPTACPPVKILPDTGSLRVTEKGTELEEGALRWLARIDKTARECVRVEDGLTARVGVAGRALAGPKGGLGEVKLPIRVAVREGEAVTYSKLHTLTVDLSAAAQDFAFVDEAVPIADEATAEILIGFDERGR